MLIVPGIAPTTGGEGKSTPQLFSRYVTSSIYRVKGKISCIICLHNVY